jgi:hypothetical protein
MSLLWGIFVAGLGLIVAIGPVVRVVLLGRCAAREPPNRRQHCRAIDWQDLACATLAETQSALILWK